METIAMILIQSVSALAYVFLISSFKKRNKKQILKSQIIASSLFTIHYFLLNAVAGFISSIIILLRNIFYHKYKKYEKQLSYVFIALFIITGLFMLDSWYSIVPIIGASINTFLMTKKKKYFLVGAVVNSVSWSIYNVFARSYVGAVVEVVVTLASLRALSKMKK